MHHSCPSHRTAPILLFSLAIALAGCSQEDAALDTTPHGEGTPVAAHAGVVLNEDFTDRQTFPADNWWNLDISSAPVDPSSQELIDWISGRSPSDPLATRSLHPDFGPPPYGMPYIGVPGDQALLAMTFVDYPDESDVGAPGRPPGYPVPIEARTLPNYIEGAVPGGGTSGDRHMILIDRDHWLLFETWATHWNAALARWEAGSGAAWSLSSNARRPEGWTSADAAGLAIFPGLIRYDETFGSEPIRHAFRFTTRATNGHVWPASHTAGDNPDAPPMGARLRLKAETDLSGYTPEVRRVFQAMKTYGLIVADNGADMYIQGTMDARWDNDILNPAFATLTADDFEVIVLGWTSESAGIEESR